MKVKRTCYYCRNRQREVRPKKMLVCQLTGKEIDKDDNCLKWENRYAEERPS